MVPTDTKRLVQFVIIGYNKTNILLLLLLLLNQCGKCDRSTITTASCNNHSRKRRQKSVVNNVPHLKGSTCFGNECVDRDHEDHNADPCEDRRAQQHPEEVEAQAHLEWR